MSFPLIIFLILVIEIMLSLAFQRINQLFLSGFITKSEFVEKAKMILLMAVLMPFFIVIAIPK